MRLCSWTGSTTWFFKNEQYLQILLKMMVHFLMFQNNFCASWVYTKTQQKHTDSETVIFSKPLMVSEDLKT